MSLPATAVRATRVRNNSSRNRAKEYDYGFSHPERVAEACLHRCSSGLNAYDVWSSRAVHDTVDRFDNVYDDRINHIDYDRLNDIDVADVRWHFNNDRHHSRLDGGDIDHADVDRHVDGERVDLWCTFNRECRKPGDGGDVSGSGWPRG